MTTDAATTLVSSVSLDGGGSLNDLPDTLHALLDHVLLGVDLQELTLHAYRKGLSPVWELGPGDQEGRLILHCQDRRWALLCSLTPVRVH
jgi:hypothetical protein